MKIVCGKCGKDMQETILDEYEFEEGMALDNVRAMRCPKNHVTFTEEQALMMEQRTKDIKRRAFRFERSVSRSARSLVIRIPVDMTRHLGINKDSKVELIPLDKKRFMVQMYSMS